MVVCEFSGEECDKTIKVEIAGAIMNVSSKYTHLGKIIESSTSQYNKLDSHGKSQNINQTTKNNNEQVSSNNFYKPSKKFIKTEMRVVDNAVSLIQSYMSKNNLTIKHISHNANVKEGTLQKMLSKKIQFDVKIAQQIEKTFKISLIEEVEINQEEDNKPEDYIVTNSSKDPSNNSMEDLLKGVLKNIK
ncbi:MAG: hypothetical protein LAT82_02185 [Nanoarchaeota archaeon]|nr:hypothetical protein [Nanoarchaeota archaeon]